MDALSGSQVGACHRTGSLRTGLYVLTKASNSHGVIAHLALPWVYELHSFFEKVVERKRGREQQAKRGWRGGPNYAQPARGGGSLFRLGVF